MEETREHTLWSAWESDGSGNKNNGHNNVTYAYMHTRYTAYMIFHMNCLMLIIILQAERMIILIPILQVKTLNFKEIYHYFHEKIVIDLPYHQLCYMWTQPSYYPGKTISTRILRSLGLHFSNPTVDTPEWHPGYRCAHEAAACPSNFSHIDQVLCRSQSCDFLSSFPKKTRSFLNECLLLYQSLIISYPLRPRTCVCPQILV